MEISQYLDFDFLIRFLEGLQKFLGENSEILIHDYRKGYDHTIIYALNPAVSGRAVGGSPKGGMITQLGKDIEPMKDSIQTFSNGPKDRFYKSFTTLIPDENGKIVGSVCVNLDVSDLLNAQRALGAFVQYPMTHHAPTNDIDALATKNVDDILKYYMKQAELLVGKPMGLMNKEEKIRRGRHTTRHSELFFVEKETFVMDTPGFSSIFVNNMKPEELKAFFPEFDAYEPECRFLGCVHVGERECGVKDAVKAGKIAESRYENYRLIYDELKSKRRY